MRAQTTLDFAVGISVFIIAVSFAVTFVPGMLEPFTTGNQEETVSANRVATQLATGTFAEPNDPYVFKVGSTGGCVREFFADSPSGTLTQCEVAGSTLAEWIGIADRQSVRIQLKGDDDDAKTVVHRLCWDSSANEVVETTNTGSCNPEFVAGGTPPTASGTRTEARRTVLIVGDDYEYDATLEVTLWR